MKTDWKSLTLKDVITLEYGKPLDNSKRDVQGLYPVYGANGIKAKSNEYYYDKKSIVVGRKGSAGELNKTPEKFWALDVTYFVKIDESKYDLDFIYYLLSTLDLPSLAKGVKPGINRNDVYTLGVKIPPFPEQKLIVAILDKAFDAIDRAITITKKNLQNIREIFESHLNKIFANPGEDWEEKYLDQISENLDSRRIPITKSKRIKGLYPYYGASGIVDYVNDYIFDEDLLLISEDGANLLARSTPIAFSVSGKIWVNNHAHILKFDNITTQKYVEMYFASIKLDEYITGAAQPKLNQAALNSILIPVPPIEEQKSIIKILENLSNQKKKLETVYYQKLKKLEELKNSILQKAFNGELKSVEEIKV